MLIVVLPKRDTWVHRVIVDGVDVGQSTKESCDALARELRANPDMAKGLMKEMNDLNKQAGPLTDDDIMPFGKYSRMDPPKKMIDVPASYFHWLWVNGKSKETATCPVARYIQANMLALKADHPDGIWQAEDADA